MSKNNKNNQPAGLLLLQPGEGRKYPCGEMKAIFKADEEETNAKYSVSEWWLAPSAKGPGAHRHEENDEVFYVLEGTASFLTGNRWVDATKGSFYGSLPGQCMTLPIERVAGQEY